MSFVYRLFSFLDRIKPARIAYAHCDVPCGIYDPHLAQVASHTVIRMVMLINELPKLTPEITPEQRQEILHKLNRYIATKEDSAELCKKEHTETRAGDRRLGGGRRKRRRGQCTRVF